MKKYNTQMIVIAGALIALHVVLSRFCSINAWNLKIGFAIVPIFIAAYFYGPVYAGIVGALGDFLGAILFPIGAYFPGFTMTCFLTGVLLGLLLHKKRNIPRILCAVLINELILSLLVNTLWISILYGSPFVPLLATRIVQCGIMVPVEVVVLCALSRLLIPLKKEIVLYESSRRDF